MNKGKRIFIVVIIFALIAGGGLGFLASRTIDSKNVLVEGNAYYTGEEIAGYILNTKWNRNPFVLYYNTKYRKQKTIPFVDKYEVKITSLDNVKITIYEKKIIGYVTYMGSNMYFDKDGTVVESSTRVIEDIPKVTGLEFDSIVLYESLPVGNDEVFHLILDVTQTLQKYSVVVDKIYIANNNEVSVYMGNVKVELGKSENIIEKISSLSDIINSPDFDKDNLSGILDMKVYNEAGEYTFERSK